VANGIPRTPASCEYVARAPRVAFYYCLVLHEKRHRRHERHFVAPHFASGLPLNSLLEHHLSDHGQTIPSCLWSRSSSGHLSWACSLHSGRAGFTTPLLKQSNQTRARQV